MGGIHSWPWYSFMGGIVRAWASPPPHLYTIPSLAPHSPVSGSLPPRPTRRPTPQHASQSRTLPIPSPAPLPSLAPPLAPHSSLAPHSGSGRDWGVGTSHWGVGSLVTTSTNKRHTTHDMNTSVFAPLLVFIMGRRCMHGRPPKRTCRGNSRTCPSPCRP
jgi:hypothetical protein